MAITPKFMAHVGTSVSYSVCTHRRYNISNDSIDPCTYASCGFIHLSVTIFAAKMKAMALLSSKLLLSFIGSAKAEHLCVDTGNDSFVCTEGSQLIREKSDFGVPQRIDGTEEEKRQIREVIEKTSEYFFNEVLVMPEYEHVRTACKNNNELCAFWTSVGECETNRVFMMSNCAAACRFCLLQYSGLA